MKKAKVLSVIAVLMTSLMLVSALVLITGASNGTTLTASELKADFVGGKFTMTYDLTLSDDASVTLTTDAYDLYLNGNTLSTKSNATKPLFVIGNGATLNVYSAGDKVTVGNGTMTANASLFEVQDGGTLNVYTVNATAATVFDIKGGAVNVKGGSYEATAKVFGIAGASRTIVYDGNFTAPTVIDQAADTMLVLGGSFNGALTSSKELRLVGGSFSADPSAFKVSNTMLVGSAPYVVKPGSNVTVNINPDGSVKGFYTDLPTAASNIPNNGYVVILQDYEPTSGTTWNGSFSLDLNGYVVNFKNNAAGSRGFDIAGNLTIIDSRPYVEHKFNVVESRYVQNDGGNKTLYGGVLAEQSTGVFLYMKKDAVFTLSGGNITGCNQTVLMTAANCIVNLNGGNFVGNSGYVYYCSNDTAQLNINAGSFLNNTKNDTTIFNKGVVNIYGGSISGSSGIGISGAGTVNMSGGSITDNAKGAINCATLNMSGGTISGNGGYGVSAGTVNLSGTPVITANINGKGEACNLTYTTATVITATDLSDGALVGVYYNADKTVFLSDVEEEWMDFFKSDSAAYTVKYVPAVTGETSVPSKLILEAPLTMTVEGYEALYDGQTHKGTVTTNFTTDVTVQYSIDGGKNWSTDVPEVKNVATVDINVKATRYGWEVVSDSYTLKVNKRAVTLTSATATKKYDATELTDDTVTVTGDGFVSGEGATYTVAGTQTKVGQSDNSFAFELKSNTTASNYTIETVIGKLTVSLISDTPIIITASDDSKTFDAILFEATKYTFTKDVLEDGDTLVVTLNGSITNAGSTTASVDTYKVMRGDVDVTAGYVFGDTVDGTLTVNPISTTPIVITAGSLMKTYDGKTLTPKFTFTDDVLADGDVLTAVVDGAITDVGTSVSSIVSYKVIRGDVDYTGGYLFEDTVDGALEITKRAVTLTSPTTECAYMGKPLTDLNVTVSGDGFVVGEGVTFNVTGQQVVIGSSTNTFTFTFNEGTKADNYEVTKVEGTLTLNRISETPIIITAGNASKQYDGTALTATAYTFNEGVLLDGDTLVVVLGGYIKDVGKCYATVSSARIMRGDFDVTAGYVFGDTVPGTLSITPRTINVTSDSKTKKYDGEALSATTLTITGDGVAEGDVITFTAVGTQTASGSSKNTVSVVAGEGTSLSNYVVNLTEGTLTVLANVVESNIDGFNVESENGLDPNVKLVVKEKAGVTANLADGLEIKTAYDLTLQKDNVTVQPDGSVKVTVTIPVSLRDEENLVIYYVAPDGSCEKLTTTRKGDTLEFYTTHFSVYALVGAKAVEAQKGEEVAMITINIPVELVNKWGKPVLIGLAVLILLCVIIKKSKSKKKSAQNETWY